MTRLLYLSKALSLSLLLVFIVGCKGITGEEIGLLTNTILVASGNDDAEKIARAAQKLASSVEGIDLETERSLGSGVAVSVFSQMGGSVDQESLQDYVAKVGLYLTEYSSRVGVPYSFAVIENDAPNAFAAPGGYIFVTTGALALMENEAELAGVLAHEIAHVELKHMLITYKRARMIDAAVTTAQDFDEDIGEYSQLIDFSQDILFNKGLDQRFEYAADFRGMEMAGDAGYDPKGIIIFLEKLNLLTNNGGGFLQTHPSMMDRIERLYNLLEEFPDQDGEILADRFERYVN